MKYVACHCVKSAFLAWHVCSSLKTLGYSTAVSLTGVVYGPGLPTAPSGQAESAAEQRSSSTNELEELAKRFEALKKR
jgi:hypothetical protein